MKKKWLAGLIPALMIIWSAAGAQADPALSCMEVVEQVAVPLALENDPRAGVNYSYSAEELAEVVRAANENGITLEENNMVMQMVQNGRGFYEETTIYRICSQVFGGDTDSWTPEEQDWYEQILVKIGLIETAHGRIPGPDNMTCGEALAFAYGRIREEYGRDLPLEDSSLWTTGCQFTQADKEDPEDRWDIWLTPLDPEHGRYSVEFHEGDAPEQASVYADVPDWTKPYTGEQLLTAFASVYSWSQGSWTQDVWQKLHEMMQKAEPDPGSVYETECAGYRMTAYPEPDGNDISREEAVRIAKAALKKDRAALDSAVLTEYEGERSWLVGMVIYFPDDGSEDPEAGSWVITVDSSTGAVRSIRDAYGARAFIPEAAYEKAEGENRKEDDSEYIRIASEAVRARYPDTDPTDETEYTVTVHGTRRHYVEFRAKSIRNGNITVEISPDGTAGEMEADAGPLDGDNIFRRYWNVYGYFGNWGQGRWIQLEKDMAELPEPLTEGGAALKKTHFPEEAAVSVGREQAKELGMEASGRRTAEVNTCVLADAQPHPVWIMRIIAHDAYDAVIGLDAETGEVVFTEEYTVDETPDYVLYSLPETWRKLTGEYTAPTPEPLPDGKPWFWGKDFAPQAYWDRAEAFMKANGVTADHVPEQEREWEKTFGEYDFWPQEYQALNVLLQLTEEDLQDPDFEYCPFPDPEKRTQKEIEETALSAVRALDSAAGGNILSDSLRAGSTLYCDSRNPDAEGENYGRPVWWVWIYRWDEEEQAAVHMEGYAILDEDGNVLTAGLGEI